MRDLKATLRYVEETIALELARPAPKEADLKMLRELREALLQAVAERERARSDDA
ncbi:hypothetical protein [Amaricoccus solimangrovi]|uniref:hypothetical protein n=1 Tax=Amaricoccus solimangrovi TaxID=2589815 RepID=UPI0015E33C88|nr:hypothetical protein [Amaricoccus solimangrovi]